TDYPDCLELIRAKVKPNRLAKAGRNATADDRARHWWLYGRWTPALAQAIVTLPRVLVATQTSETWAPVFLPNGYIYSHKTLVFATQHAAAFAALQSSFHHAWR